MKKVTLLCMVLYLCFLSILTLSPFDFRYFPRENWLQRSFDLGVFDVVANFLLFSPWGLFLSLLLAPSGPRNRLRQGILLSAGLSLSIELAQIMIPSRFPSLIDIVSNTAGGAVGFLISEKILKKRGAVWIARCGNKAAVAGLIFYLIFLFLLALFSWEKLDRWEPGLSLWVGNGPDREDRWPGQIFSLAVYDRALTEEEIGRHYRAGHRSGPDADLEKSEVVRYPFDEGAGTVAHDRAPGGSPLILQVREGAVTWLDPAGVAFEGPAYFFSRDPAGKFLRRIGAGSRFTVEGWVVPALLKDGEVGSILLLSKAPDRTHFVLQQQGRDLMFDVRNRNKTGQNGSALETNGLKLSSRPTHLIAIYDLGRMALYVDGRKVGGAILTDGLFLMADRLALNTIAVGGRAFLGLFLFWPFGLLLSFVFRVRSPGRLIGAALGGWLLFGVMQMLQVRHPAVFFTGRTVWVPMVAIVAGIFSGWFVQSHLQPKRRRRE
jgi:glycopeptide antibiotics resistance protein